MSSDNLVYKNQAIDALLKADPASASPEAKKKVARAFKALAEDNDTFDRQKAVRGLVKWAGTYSVPILLKMLNSGNPFDEEAVLRALAELKDARGAPALAKRLKDFRLKEVARDGLVAMGSGAEDAVLALANTDDADLYNTVIALLGDVGTEKCLDVLRQARKRAAIVKSALRPWRPWPRSIGGGSRHRRRQRQRRRKRSLSRLSGQFQE